MPTDPGHRALLCAVEKLTTQVRRIADTLADGTVQDSFALAPPVVTDDDGAQTTADDAPRTRGAEKQRTIRRQQFRLLLNQLNDGTPLTPAQVQALTAYVADEIVECNMETQEADRLETEAADWKATAAVYSGLHRTAENELKQAHAELAEATAAIERVRRALADRPADMVRNALDGPVAEG
ncbi:hypothetical protein ACFZDM_33475 [Streptomyces californicus]|uniref:hypothetical protein n=1 Tax=Streptomyces californicus TaxID=67351 RepID=UPI0036E96BCA